MQILCFYIVKIFNNFYVYEIYSNEASIFLICFFLHEFVGLVTINIDIIFSMLSVFSKYFRIEVPFFEFDIFQNMNSSPFRERMDSNRVPDRPRLRFEMHFFPAFYGLECD